MTTPEHPTGPTGSDQLAETLAGLRDGVDAPPPRSASAARRTASRRQGARLAVAAAAVAAVVVGVPLGVSLGAIEAAPPVAPSTEEPSLRPVEPSVTPVDPSLAPSVDPSTGLPPAPQEPETSTPPSAPPNSPDAGAVVRPPVEDLQVISSSTEAVTAGELAGADFGLGLDGGLFGRPNWSLDPCQPTAWPLDARRTGWASQGVSIGDGTETREVAVYAEEVDAVESLAAFRRVAEACWAEPGDLSASSIWVETTPEGDRATVFAGLVRTYDPDLDDGYFGRDGMAWAAVRQGRTVALVTSADFYLGGWIAAVQGDTRPGAKAVTHGGAEPEAVEYVDFRLADARADAQQLLDDHAP